MFSGPRNPTVLLEILSDVTGSQKSKMGASNLEIRLSRLVDMTATKFQRLPYVFGDKVSNGTIGNTVRRNWKSENQDGGLQSGNTYISTCGHDSNNIRNSSSYLNSFIDTNCVIDFGKCAVDFGGVCCGK